LVIIDIRPEIQPSPKIEDALEKAAERTLAIEKSEDCEVSILLTNDAEIQKLNATYRDVDAPTDVLAFAMREGTDGDLNSEILGDVVISIQTAERQAEEYGHSVEAELSLLVIHGILHLLGYDHAEKDEAQIMQEKQKEIIYLLGYYLAESKLMLETS
jgi:probable rRNA maturation factor